MDRYKNARNDMILYIVNVCNKKNVYLGTSIWVINKLKFFTTSQFCSFMPMISIRVISFVFI